MLKKYSFLLVFFFCLIAGMNDLHAQKRIKKDKFGFYFKGKHQTVSKIKFELYSNLIVVKVKINNSDTLNFILDTGVSSFIITDPTLGEKLGLNFTRQVRINGAGENAYINANVSIGHEISLGGIRAEKQNLVVLESDILKLSEYMGVPIHGIFGHDLFDRFVVKIDFGSKEIRLYDSKKYKYKKSKGEMYPLVVTQSKPYIEAIEMAQNTDKEFTKLRLVIDTGAGHALMLNTQDTPPIHLPDKVIRANLGKGLNGDINGHIGRIERFKIGKYEFKDVLASFPDSLSFSLKFGETSDIRQGSIGGEFLRRFVITFNYREGYLVLKPLKINKRETFEHDMSGMEVRAKGANYDDFFISFVTPNSQAEKAGIKEGDQIIFMNNKHYKELNINDIYKKLSSKEGTEIELFVRRNGELKFCYFKLKRII
ncbi:signal protein PDZ [Lacihabitans sp. LS3-19]|uniref:aspartyl protease family protein n=1 Tax=Lacihabitans sp. LS3-19 TaxID=2487335 RepID=UPI0020CEA24F|nr:aspartyl protease family protein [Lacihabitans sp. LS3-19]MCP9767571.1 signal protein PDZ [Lacihabitans sp. LS3-19]